MTKNFQNLQLYEFSPKKIRAILFFHKKFLCQSPEISFWNTKNVKIHLQKQLGLFSARSTLVSAGSTFGSARATWDVDQLWGTVQWRESTIGTSMFPIDAYPHV
jgi:hypothetical protein